MSLTQHFLMLVLQGVEMPVHVHVGVNPVMPKKDGVWDQVVHYTGSSLVG